LREDDTKGHFVIQGREVPVFIIKENLKIAGISRKNYIKYFKI